MRRSEVPGIFCKFKDLHQRVLHILQLEQDDPDLKAEFDQLILLVTENLDLFSEEERSFILRSHAVFLTPRYRVARQRSHSRSASPSRSESASSPESSFASASLDSSAAMSDTSKTAPEGAGNTDKDAGNTDKDAGNTNKDAVPLASRQLKELALQYDLEEENETLRDKMVEEKRRLEDAQRRVEDAQRRVEDERRKVKKELEAKQRANRRAILQRAEKEGLRDDFVADLLNSLEVVTIDEPADVSSSPSDPPPPPLFQFLLLQFKKTACFNCWAPND